jgi:hypothetical protein
VDRPSGGHAKGVPTIKAGQLTEQVGPEHAQQQYAQYGNQAY